MWGKMYGAVVFLCLISILRVSADCQASENIEDVLSVTERNDIQTTADDPLEAAIKSFAHEAWFALKTDEKGSSHGDYVDRLYYESLRPLAKIVALLKDTANVYKFLDSKGIERVIFPFLGTENTDLRTELLKLLKLLFDEAPTTTTVVIPMGVLDRLLNILEEDDNMQLKSRTMEILAEWLPDNPAAQARVMKLKGLEPFYEQIYKLDSNGIFTVIKMFSKIIKEHIKVRNDVDKTQTDYNKIDLYRKIGLIERLGTNRVCHGIFNIFQHFWVYNNVENQKFFVPMFEILSDIQPYCIHTLKGRPKALDMLSNMHQRVKELSVQEKTSFEGMGLNVTDLQLVLDNYVEKLKAWKDEL